MNLRRTSRALQRPRPAPPAAPVPTGVETTYGAPRSLLFVTVKRDNPSWADLYGHWWLEIGEQSYGWWPRAVPVGMVALLTGTGGVLNGMGLFGRSGTWDRDPQHGQIAAHAFHPVLTLVVSDAEVQARVRGFAQSHHGRWRWAWSPRAEGESCRSFQDDLLRAAGLQEGIGDLASRGSGCPFLYRPRSVLWWLQDQVRRPSAARSTR